MARAFRILAATDGSPSAHAALVTALAFPWPQASRARAVVALGRGLPGMPQKLRAAAVRALHEEIEPARRTLERRWPDADAVALHGAPAKAILAEARRFGADVVALGWRGHGSVRRLMAGSVSREVAARAGKPVLIARSAAEEVRRVIVGFDGSPEAQRAVRFLSRLEPRPGTTAIVVTVSEPLWVPHPTRRLPASTRTSLVGAASRFNRKRDALARAKADAAASILKRAGWAAKSEVRAGAPLEGLLAACGDLDGDILAVGAPGAGRLTRALVESVTTGALNRSRIPVLLVP